MGCGCINSAKAARIKARIIKNEALLATYEEALSNAATHVEEYRLDTGEGSQRTKYKDPRQLKQIIDSLESSIEADYRTLARTGIVNMNLRRKHYNRGF